MLYRWWQDNVSVTVDITVPAHTLPTQLSLRLGRNRITLVSASDGSTLLRRRTYAPIEPRCTECYTMPEGTSTVRAVLYKATHAGWLSLFAGDAPGQAMMASPAPLSHAMAHAAALARAREAAAREAAALALRARAVSRDGSRPQQTWRHGCHVIRRKAPGGVRIHYGREPPVYAGAAAAASSPPPPPGYRLRQDWSAMRRHTPHRAPLAAEELAAAAAAAAEKEAAEWEEAAEEEAEAGSRVPSRKEAEAARSAIESVRKGEAPELPAGDDSSDEEESGNPDDIDYPLPGSEASCDACARIIDKYYHCVQCGVIDGFDLCAQCHRAGIWPDKHLRRYPNHHLAFVSKLTAPVIGKEPKLRQAPPAPTQQAPPHGFDARQAVSERVIIPLEAKVKYHWSQFSSEVNLSVAIPAGTRARELIVVVQPFLLSISLKGHGVILKGSFYKGVRHRETVWTIEEGMLRILLVKGDQQSWKKLFPHEQEMSPMQAIQQICEDPEPVSHGYMDLTPEARGIVDMHRSFKHAMATGDYNEAQELEEEMKLMRFNWGNQRKHMEAP